MCVSPQSMDSSDLSDGPITLQEYLEVKKALASSEAKVQQLMKVNNNLSEELRRLQKEVGRRDKNGGRMTGRGGREGGMDRVMEGSMHDGKTGGISICLKVYYAPRCAFLIIVEDVSLLPQYISVLSLSVLVYSVPRAVLIL